MNLRKKLLLGLAVLLPLLFGVMYVVVVQHAESLLQHFVVTQSKGKMELKVHTLKVNLLPLRLELDSPEFQTNDSTRLETAYQIKAKSIILRLKSLWPILFIQPIGVDSMVVQSPLIEVYKYGRVKQEHISLPVEMGLVYQSMEKVLAHLYLEYLRVQDAKFVVYNPGLPEKKPLSVSNLNLTINKVNNQSGAANERFLYADRILLELFNQEIVLPDGYHGMKFKRFRLSTGSQTIKLDSCTLYVKPSDSSKAEFSSFIDSLRIYKFDFNALANKSELKMDSALCFHPEVNIHLPMSAKNAHNSQMKEVLLHKDSLNLLLKKMLGNLDIAYLAVRDAKIHLEIAKSGKRNFFDLDKSQFSMVKLRVNSDPQIPLQLERLNLQLHNYSSYTSDSLYLIGFDEVQLINKNISLTNFRFEPTSKNHARRGNSVRMASFEFNEIEWPILLYENRIVAGRMLLVRPLLHFRLPKKSGQANPSPTFHLDMLGEFRQKIDVAGISVEDGTIQLEGQNGMQFALEHLNAGVDVKQLLLANTYLQTIEALNSLSFTHGEFSNREVAFKIAGGSYTGSGKLLKIKSLAESRTDKSMTVKLKNISLSGINVNSGASYSLSELAWESGDLLVSPSGLARKSAVPAPEKKIFELSVGKIAGGMTRLTYRGANLEASTVVNHISSGKIVIKNGEKPVVQGLMVDGQSFSLSQNKLKGSFSAFQIHDSQRSTIDNVEIKMPLNEEMVTFYVPRLIFSVNIAESVKGNLLADYVEMQKPSISFQSQTSIIKSDSGKVQGKFPLLNIKSLKIDQPKFLNLPAVVSHKMVVDPGKALFSFRGINSDSTGIHLDTLRLRMDQPLFSNAQVRLVPTGGEAIGLTLSDFNFFPANNLKKAFWSFNLDELKSSILNINLLHGDTVSQRIGVNQFQLRNFLLNNVSVGNQDLAVRQNDRFHFLAGQVSLDNGITRVVASNINLDRASNSISLDSMAFFPLLDKERFMKDKIYRTGYMRLYTGPVRVKGINVPRLVHEQIFEAVKANVNDLQFLNFIDKRLPMQQGIEKPMLTDLLTRVRAKFAVDSLVLKNGRIEAEEINDKTFQTGVITLTKIRGGVTGIRNFDFKRSDSLKFNLYAKLLDTAQIRVNYSQSYTDSLSSFHLKAIVSSFDLSALNPMLKPFASAQVNRGYLDTLRMSVVGRKHVAFGTMKMYYHDLHVAYLNKGVDTHPTFKTRMISFFANRIVHNKNQMGSGDVYAERDPEKGFVNYWVKIFIGGVFTNTGVRTDKKQIKKYTKSIRKYKVPPIPHIPVDF